MRTLDTHVCTYITGRHRRGEIGDATRSNMRTSLGGLSDSFGRRPLDQLTHRAVDRWLETITRLAPSTRRNHLCQARGFLGWMRAEELIEVDPIGHVPPIHQPRRVPVTLNGDAVDVLLASLPDLRARVIVGLMVDLGARCVEVSRLTVEDWDPSTRVLTLTGKGGHERVVPAGQASANLIDAYLAETGVIGGPLVRQYEHPTRALSAQTVSRYVSDWMAGAGVKARAFDGRSAHGLRRTCGSDVMDACGDVRIVQAVLGHARIETTARYYLRPVTVEQMRSAMAARGEQQDERASPLRALPNAA